MTLAGAPINLAGREVGFSLIELLIAIAITAIVAVMVTPSFAQIMGERRVQAGAVAMAATLRKAQASAIARNRIVEVLFTAAEPVPTGVLAATSAAASNGRWLARTLPTASAADFIDGYDAAAQLPTVTIASTQNAFGFTPLGRPVLLGGTVPTALTNTVVVRFSDGPTSRRICTYLTTGGAISTCDPTLASGKVGSCQPQLPASAC